MSAIGLGVQRGRVSPGTGPHESPPAGVRILIPGYVQWSWRQYERGLVFFGSFAASLVVGAFAWGTWTGVAMLAFAFTTHVVSAVDVIRQSAFPGFGAWMPVFSVSGGLGLGVYAPIAVLATSVAWPVMDRGSSLSGYLVNCWAYHARPPIRGEWVWMRSSPWGELRVGEIIAAPGEEVEWSANRLRVNGVSSWRGSPFRTPSPPDDLQFKVPDGFVLVDPEAGVTRGVSSAALVLVPCDQIAGRAWARSYPYWERRLLP